MTSSSMNCSTANSLDLVDYLDTLGHRPVKVIRFDHWYHSPFRSERTPSFKINRQLNRWFDFGEGVGGSLVDFGIRYTGRSVSEFLKQLEGNASYLAVPVVSPKAPLPIRDNAAEVLHTGPIASLGLLHYLLSRRIPLSIAQAFCREIIYQTGPIPYHALALPNDRGGFDIRSERFKGTIAPKSPTTIRNSSKRLRVFEGMFDFLSFLTLTENQCQPVSNFFILNSVAFLDKSRAFIESFESIELFLDHDSAGENATARALGWNAHINDASGFYAGYKDLNEWLMHFGKTA